jgi:hypothetical protein
MSEKADIDLNNDEVLTSAEVMKLLKISKNSANDFLRRAHETQSPFPVLRIGKLYRVPKERFMSWLRCPDRSEPPQ